MGSRDSCLKVQTSNSLLGTRFCECLKKSNFCLQINFTMTSKNIKIKISEEIGTVSGIFTKPEKPVCVLVLAHGAGAGMTHSFMETLANDLAANDIAVLRFNFAYMENGKGAPDRPKKAHPAIAAAVKKAEELAEGLPILASGKSFGGRMTSQLAATGALENVKALVFYGFPLHAPGKVGTERAAHLQDIQQPMLFLQGTRDNLAKVPLIQEVCDALPSATLSIQEGADHSFKMLKRSGITHEEMIQKLAKTTKEFYETVKL